MSSNESETIKVLICDDHAILRSGLRMLLNAEPDMTVVGEATDGIEAVELAGSLEPDLVLMDIAMPGMSGIEATEAIRRQHPQVKVLILTMHENEEYLFRTIRAGGGGYVLKKAADSELIEAIHQVMQGDAFLGPRVSAQIVQDYMERVETGEEQDSYARLTDREREILKLVAEGNTNQAIAKLLVISVRTVETHRAHIMDKLGLQNRAELVKYALRKGLLD